MWLLKPTHKHIGRNTLSEYLDGRLQGRDLERVEQQLGECHPCRLELEELQATVAMMRQLPMETPRRSFVMSAPPLEPARAEPARAEPARAEPARAEPARAEPARAEPARAEPARAEPARAEPARAEPARAEPARAEPARAGPGPARAQLGLRWGRVRRRPGSCRNRFGGRHRRTIV